MKFKLLFDFTFSRAGKQAEAEVVPSSSLVEVEFGVEVGVEVGDYSPVYSIDLSLSYA